MAATRRGKPAKSESRGLTKDLIVQGALALVDELGLEKFSVRTLAERLSVYPAAIRWWVPTRNALLAEIVNYSYREVTLADTEIDWKEWIRQFFVSQREVMRRHPNIAPLLASQLLSNAGADLVMVEKTLVVLDRAGFTGERLLEAFDVVIAGALGFVAMEFAAAPSDDEADFQGQMRTRIDEVDGALFPMIARHRYALRNRHFILRWENGSTVPLDASFDAFTFTIIEGLRLLLTR